ncbi:hypothetical protein E1171_16275 [Cytophagales bacterium RKSG123]|nr:hypothetical protein [Xanthovirga aplysinae]
MPFKYGHHSSRNYERTLPFWLEIPTGASVISKPNDQLDIFTPIVLQDFFDLSVKPTPDFIKEKLPVYQQK